MSTINSNFVLVSSNTLEGAAYATAPTVQPYNKGNAQQIASGGGGTQIDVLSNLAAAGFAKNGAVGLSLTGTTAITLNLLAIAAATGVVVCGDSLATLLNSIEFVNTGAVDLVVSPGGSNPQSLGLAGTTPSFTVPAGSRVLIQSVAGLSVDSTHKNITITPTAGGSMGIAFGGV